MSLPPPVSQRDRPPKDRPKIPVVKVAQPVRQSWTQAKVSTKDTQDKRVQVGPSENFERVQPLHVHVGNPMQPTEETQSEIFWDF